MTTDTTPAAEPAAAELAEYAARIMFIGLTAASLFEDTKRNVRFLVLKPEQYDGTGIERDELKDRERNVEYQAAFLRKIKRAKPGAIYAVSITKDGLRYSRGMFPVAHLQNMDLRVELVAAYQKEDLAREAAAAIRKDGALDVVKQQCLPLRRAYRRASSAARPHLLAQIVTYIVSAQGDA